MKSIDRPVTRRRGDELDRAIRQAVFEELLERGYSELTMEGVASRAGTGKAPLYRRWPSKRELVLASIEFMAGVTRDPPPDTGTLRGDLLRLLGRMTAATSSVAEQAANTLIWERGRHPEIADAAVEQLIRPRLDWIRDTIARAVQRGEIQAPASLDLMARIGPAMIIQHLLETGAPPTRHRLTAIVDQVLLPALSG